MRAARSILERVVLELRSLQALAKAGVLPLSAPHALPAIAAQLAKFGPFGAAVAAAAVRHRDRTAIVDERGELTYGEFDQQINRLANIFATGYGPGTTVGVLCRNHRGSLLVAFAASRAGLTTVLLNTSFSVPQTADVVRREGVDVLFHDADLAEVAADVGVSTVAIDIGRPTDELTELTSGGSAEALPAPPKPGRLVILTSGTTGTPKGAVRTEPKGYTLPGSILERIPMRARETTVIAPPIFHGTALIWTLISLSLGSRVVLRRRFDPEAFLADIERYGAASVCVAPVMLQRVLALPAEATAAHRTSSLRIVFCAGSSLHAAVSEEWHRRFGETIYNLYGSTEVSVASIATPDVVREHPTSVGRPVLGSRVEIVDDDGRILPEGERGRIFVGTVTPFEGYTGGGSKEVVDGMLSTGEVGYLRDGLLHIDGRDDDMIVSGGENVFPAEVEELLVSHPAVRDVAVLGVDDAEFGQRLRAFVCLHEGALLTADEAREFVRTNLARYKVPRDVVFVDDLPRNATGKVLKRELSAGD